MRHLDFCKKRIMECVFSEFKPAETLAAELICRDDASSSVETW